MKRLGFWNRLALVVTLLVTAGLPIYFFFDYVHDAEVRNAAWRDLCLAQIGASYMPTTHQGCWDEYARTPNTPSAEIWWQGALAGFAICAIVYLLIWAIASTARWIWRGRVIGKSSSL